MVFWAVLIFDLAAAVAVTVSVARFFRNHGTPALLSYLFYLVFWYALALYMLIFLFAPHVLPASAQRGYLLFNSVFIVPLNGVIAYFFADFIWKWLNKTMPWLLRLGLPLIFAAILAVYTREILGELSSEAQPEAFLLSVPASMGLMFACLLLAALYAAVASRRMEDRERGRSLRLFALVNVCGLILGFVFVFGTFSILSNDWQNAIGSLILVSVNITAWGFARRFFRGHARAIAAELARADLSGLKARYEISPRECEIISLMIAGKSNREITEALYISPETVKKHVYNIYRKIEIKNRVQLVNAVLESSASPSIDRS